MTLSLALFIHAVAVLATVLYFRMRVERALSMMGLTLLALTIVHGAPVLVYLLFTGPETLIFEAALDKGDRAATMAQLPTALAVMFLCIILGAEAARLLFGDLPRRPRTPGRRRLRSSAWARSIRLGAGGKVILWLVAGGVSAVSIAENQLGKTIAYFASGESEIGKILLRVEEGATPYYLYNVLLSAITPFMVMIALCAARNEPRRASLWLLAATLLLTVLLGKFGTLSKAPPVIFLMQILLLFVLLRRKRLNAGMTAQLLIAGIILFGIIVNATIPDLDTQAVLAFLYYRVFDIPNESLLEYFAAIPRTLEHSYGAGIFSLLRETPKGEYIPMMSAVAEVTRGNLISTSNALFIGDAWAEFGWLGIISFSCLAGFILYSYDRYAFRKGNTDEAACLVAGGSYGIFTLMSTALNTALVTGGLLLLPALAYILISSPRTQRRGMHPPSGAVTQTNA